MSERLIDAVCPHCGKKGKTVRLVSHDDGHTKLSRLCTNCGGEWTHTFDRDWLSDAKNKRLEAEVDRLTRERDESRAEVERLRADIERIENEAWSEGARYGTSH